MIKSRMALLVLGWFLAASVAHADALTLTGTVTYRERMALPAGATLHVGLVTLPDGRPVVGAATVIASKSTPPIEFALNIRSDLATTGTAYGLIAEIRAGNGVLFRNARAVPIDPVTHAPVNIVVERQQPSSTLPTPPEMPVPDPALVDTIWRVSSIGSKPLPSDLKVTLSIAADLRAGGEGGCNSYFTEASLENDELTFGPAAATRMACPPDTMAVETSYFIALSAVRNYQLDGDSLRLLDAAGVPLIGLVRMNEE